MPKYPWTVWYNLNLGIISFNKLQPQLTEKLDWEIDDEKTIFKRGEKSMILNNWLKTGKDERVQYYANNSVRHIIRFSEKISYCADNTQILYQDLLYV